MGDEKNKCGNRKAGRRRANRSWQLILSCWKDGLISVQMLAIERCFVKKVFAGKKQKLLLPF
jgi:hypothetical protein